MDVIGLVILVVLLHNALALNIGYWSARLFRLPEPDSRAVAIEVGIPELGPGAGAGLQFFRRSGRYGYPGGMVGHLAYCGRTHHSLYLYTLSIARIKSPSDFIDAAAPLTYMFRIIFTE